MILQQSENLITFYARAKYTIDESGELIPLKVQEFGLPVFHLDGYVFEKPKKKKIKKQDELCDEFDDILQLKAQEDNKLKAMRRARDNAFDKILCNRDLNIFATITLSPDKVENREDWNIVYNRLRSWLNNSVTRNGLKYILCVERHKNGGLHFHAIMNEDALTLIPAINSKTGKEMKKDGKTIYNIKNWKIGFSTAIKIGNSEEDRIRVAKYIFKYITKGEKIGGRYLLSGGNLKKPIYEYGNSIADFDISKKPISTYKTTINGIKYNCVSYI